MPARMGSAAQSRHPEGVWLPPMRPGSGLALLLAVMVGAVGAPGAVAADNGLVLSRADVPGYRPAGAGAGVARAALGGRAPSALRRVPAQGAAYRAGKRRLSVGVFRLGTPNRARRTLGGLARGGRRLRVGDGGALRVRRTRR